jgi:hypothetical protein
MEAIQIINRGNPHTTDVLWHGIPTRSVTEITLQGDPHGMVTATMQVICEVDIYPEYNRRLLWLELNVWKHRCPWLKIAEEKLIDARLFADMSKELAGRVHLVSTGIQALTSLLYPDGHPFKWIGARLVEMDGETCFLELNLPKFEVGDSSFAPREPIQAYVQELQDLVIGLHYPEVQL